MHAYARSNFQKPLFWTGETSKHIIRLKLDIKNFDRKLFLANGSRAVEVISLIKCKNLTPKKNHKNICKNGFLKPPLSI